MRGPLAGVLMLAGFLGGCLACHGESHSLPDRLGTNLQTFAAKGIVKELKADGRTVVVAHEPIAGYMEAMTMPFRAGTPADLAGLRAGDKISFRLAVTPTESWIEHISKTGRDARAVPTEVRPHAAQARAASKRHPLLDCPFTNELGQAVTLGSFRGQALAITFFFTRCPIPEFCPRLSKNFEEAAQKLHTLADAPTNWHFLSVSFDTRFDTPAVLKAYGERYHYDPRHWSFLTGPADKIAELASLSNVEFEQADGLFSHNFRTLIIDPAGHLQAAFPVSGDLTDAIVQEILKAAAKPVGAADRNENGQTPGG